MYFHTCFCKWTKTGENMKFYWLTVDTCCLESVGDDHPASSAQYQAPYRETLHFFMLVKYIFMISGETKNLWRNNRSSAFWSHIKYLHIDRKDGSKQNIVCSYHSGNLQGQHTGLKCSSLPLCQGLNCLVNRKTSCQADRGELSRNKGSSLTSSKLFCTAFVIKDKSD